MFSSEEVNHFVGGQWAIVAGCWFSKKIFLEHIAKQISYVGFIHSSTKIYVGMTTKLHKS